VSIAQKQSRRNYGAASTESATQKITGIEQLRLDLDSRNLSAGCFNDCFTIRAILVDAIKLSNKSRIQIAEEMSLLVGRKITERMLNGFTAESKKDCRWPAELDRAFCEVTGDVRLIASRLEQTGMHVISDADLIDLELGRQFRARHQADAEIAMLLGRRGGSL
jgi:hypothetical protein